MMQRQYRLPQHKQQQELGVLGMSSKNNNIKRQQHPADFTPAVLQAASCMASQQLLLQRTSCGTLDP